TKDYNGNRNRGERTATDNRNTPVVRGPQQTLTSHSFFIGHLSFVIDPFRSSSLEFSLQVAPAPRQSELPKREGGYALLFATRQRLTEKVVKKSTSRGVAWVSARPRYWSGQPYGVAAKGAIRRSASYSAHDFINAPTYFPK